METQGCVQSLLKKKLAIVVKTYTKADVKVFWSCPILLGFSFLGKIFIIILAYKFQFKTTILSVWAKFTQKGYSQFKPEPKLITSNEFSVLKLD